MSANAAGDRPETTIVSSAIDDVGRGDREAFGRIVALYQKRLFGLTLMMTRDPSGAEEIAQDAFVRALIHLDRYDRTRPFYPWLATIAVRLAQTWLRRHGRLAAFEGTPIGQGHDRHSSDDPLEDLVAGETDRRLWRAVAALPSGERTAVYLYYRQEMSVNDTARALGVTGGTVKTLLFRARRRLRRALDSAGDDDARGEVR